jgi:hypothetical protein
MNFPHSPIVTQQLWEGYFQMSVKRENRKLSVSWVATFEILMKSQQSSAFLRIPRPTKRMPDRKFDIA